MINILFCFVIFLPGYPVFRQQEKISALLLSVAFGVSALSHSSVLTGIVVSAIRIILLSYAGIAWFPQHFVFTSEYSG